MKIVFCGPPHSGKTVFIANLVYKLPTDDCTVIRTCPDGEGFWSNNQNQKEIQLVRKKGKYTESFIKTSCQAIDNQTNKIVLVDAGGRINREKEIIFRHCDSFIVLSNDDEKKEQWLQFGQDLGLECIACLDSRLEGEEEIYSRTPYLQGRIVGLERGKVLKESNIVNALVSDIVEKSKYGEKSEAKEQQFDGIIIDDTELGFELGYGKEIDTESGITIRRVRWSENAISQIYGAITQKVSGNERVRINGIRPNFILSAICKACKKQGVTDISTYDIRSKQYIPIRNLPKKKGIKQAPGLSYNIIQNKETIFMDIDITDEQYTLENYEQCILPKINDKKNLYLSGRLPLWLLASMTNSYDANKIFTFRPGKGFTCVASNNEKDLGLIVDGVEGIDINRYFMDKRDANKEKLPTKSNRQGLLSGIRNIWFKLKENKSKSKYLDDSIKSNRVFDCQEAQKSDSKEFRIKMSQPIELENNISFETKAKRGNNNVQIQK